MQILQAPPTDKVVELLASAGLPNSDVINHPIDYFFGCWNNGALCGVVGLESYGRYGLLRSLVVAEESRLLGYGKALVERIEYYALDIGLEVLYLLTETAQHFFANLGYVKVPRTEIPDSIRGTEEFRSLCPDSAIVMTKALTT